MTKIFNMADGNKCYGGNNAEEGVTGLKVVPSSQQDAASLMAGFWSLLYLGAPSELSEKQLLCGYLAMSVFFPSTCCSTVIMKKCYRNVFCREKKERELSFLTR